MNATTANTTISPYITKQSDFSDIRLIGKGPYAEVYKALQTLPSGEKAERVVRYLPRSTRPYFLKRERDLLRYFNRYPKYFPHFHEIRHVGLGYLEVFEYKGKRNLQQQVLRNGPLTEKQALSFLKRSIKTLRISHEAGFLHTDIKPENFLWHKGKSYLIDWSQATPALPSYEMELLIGDKRYSPPERLNGSLTEKSDIYSLGCTLYFALTGRHIFQLEEEPDVLKQLSAHALLPPMDVSILSKKWRWLVLWMTQKAPNDRPTLQQLQDWLEEQKLPKAVKNRLKDSALDLPDLKEGEEVATQLRKKGYFYAYFLHALMREREAKWEEALDIYEDLAFKGYSRAMNNAGHLLEKQGGPNAVNKAAMHYESAYRLANPYASYNLARLMKSGHLGKTSQQTIHKLYEFSAMRGHTGAQLQLGKRYLSVETTEVQKAKYWLTLAALSGEKAAKQILAQLQDNP
jgi:hypothetical protein